MPAKPTSLPFSLDAQVTLSRRLKRCEAECSRQRAALQAVLRRLDHGQILTAGDRSQIERAIANETRQHLTAISSEHP